MTDEESLELSELDQDLQDELELLREIFFKEIKLYDRYPKHAADMVGLFDLCHFPFFTSCRLLEAVSVIAINLGHE